MSRQDRFSEQYRKRIFEEQLARCGSPALATVIERNIAAIAESRAEAEKARGFQERVADRLTRLFGNVVFVYLHGGLLLVWLLGNSGLFGNEPFDPYPYGLLTLALSIEAIFLTVIVLISENRQSQMADRRAELDLQINLLAEYEITRILELTAAIAARVGVDCSHRPELGELASDIEPKAILKELDVARNQKVSGPADEPPGAD